jgi:hypothetical protein
MAQQRSDELWRWRATAVFLLWIWTTTMVVMVAVAACAGSGAQNAGATVATGTASTKRLPADLCTLVTAAQLQQMTGVAFNPVTSINPGGSLPSGAIRFADCHATTVDQSPSGIGLAGYALLVFDSPADASAAYTNFKAGVARGGGNPTDVGGLGDQAFVGNPGPLYVLKGAVVINVTVALATMHSDPGAEKQVAAIILAQL